MAINPTPHQRGPRVDERGDKRVDGEKHYVSKRENGQFY